MITPELWANVRIRRTPYTERVEAAGVTAYTVYNHMLLPLVFRSLEEDYWHLKEHVQVWDVSCQRQVELIGPDAARLMQLLTPRDLTTARPGRCLYAPLVDQRGGLLNDPVVLKLADDRFWISISDLDIALWAKGVALGMGLDVDVFEADVWPLAVQGPGAEQLVGRVLGDAVRDIGFFRFAHLEFRGHRFAVARTGWSKQGGFEIYVDHAELALPLWDALIEAGADLDVRPGCPNHIERIEGGLISYGSDATIADNPLECRLEHFCHLDAPIEFIGRDALLAIRDAGPARRLMGLFIDVDGMPPVRHRWPVIAEGRTIGGVTSAVPSPSHGRGVAMAMLQRGHWDAGRRVTIDSPIGSLPGEVTDLPFPAP